MNNFLVNPSISAEIISKYSCKHELSAGDVEVLMNTIKGKKEKEVNRVLTVQRGIPAWLQELEGSSAAIAKRTPKPLAEFVNQEKNSN